MKPTTLSQHGSSLLRYAISKLDPEIFSHPVWIRFGQQEVSIDRDLIGGLLSTTEGLEKDDPGGTCQVLLICSVCQNYAGQPSNALRTIRKALALADHASLARETIWALWGAGAISYQQGDYEQAGSHFADLQAVLIKQDEWILADFVDVLKQSLFQSVTASAGKHSGSPRDPPAEDLLALTFDWLQQWGFSAQPNQSELGLKSTNRASQANSPSTVIQPFFSMRSWQGLWHAFRQAIRGGLEVHWAKGDVSSKQGLTPGVSFPKLEKALTDQEKDVNHLSRQAATLIPVAVHMLGAFSLTIGELPVKLPASRGLSVLKYLLLHYKQGISREILMDIFWPDVDPETARNNLNVAIHSLRTALRKVIFLPVILFEDGAYRLAPDLQVWVDVEEFERCVKAGQRLDALHQLSAAAAEYEAAISLYQGDFLEDHPYEGWTMLEREHFRIAYLDALDRLSQIYFDQERYATCIAVSQRILTRDRCREDAHCLLMRCYSRQGQYQLALRQYQSCVEALHDELEMDPAQETTQLYERMRRRERI